ncbi:MAG: alcohol dehydrogenase [Pedosphaera sp.]|nr:alcohol dehydrogenase [Pedosphaera sp.]
MKDANPIIQMVKSRFLVHCLFAITPVLVLTAGDWSQYRGPTHDGLSSETIRSNWSSEAPREIWRVPMVNGFSSFSVSNGRAFTLVERTFDGSNKETCIALNSATGLELWATVVDTAENYDGTGISAAAGPRSTPVVDGDRVFILSAYLGLYCLNASSGDVLWQKSIHGEYGGGVISWQSSAAPLIEGDLVIIQSRAEDHSLMAFRKQDGTEVWARHNDLMTHASPVTVTLNGVRQVIFYAQSGLVSLDPGTGNVLWRHKVNYNGTSAGASPVVAGDLIYCSRAYPGSLSSERAGATVMQLTKTADSFSTKRVWYKVNQLMNHWSTPVHDGGYLYGIYGHYNSGASPIELKCIDMQTGEEKWSQGLSSEGSRSGGLLKVGKQMLLLTERGDLVLFEPSAEAFKEIARHKALGGRSWNVPAISNGRIYARSTTEAVCLDVSLPAPPSAPLKLQASLSSGRSFGLEIGTADDSPIDANRASMIDILFSGDLLTDLASWTKVSTAPQITNGRLRFEDPETGVVPRRYFRIQERR